MPRFLLPALPFLLCLALPPTALALDYSVPAIRNGLPYFGPGGVAGFGAVVGQIEVRGEEGNGIDGFDGHRQSGLGPNPGDLDYGLYGFQDVRDFSGQNDPTDHNFHGTFVAGVMASEYVSVSTPTETLPFLGVAPLARYYGALFDGAGTKAGFLSLNDSLRYLAVLSGVSVINHSWGSNSSDASQLDGSSFGETLLLDEYAGYNGKSGGTTGGYLDKLMVISSGNSGEENGLLGSPADSFNGLIVGALDAFDPAAGDLTDPGRKPTARVAPYSSFRPLARGRAGVHLVAPGTNLWSTLSINYFDQNDLVAGVASGTSFAAPHVTGAAALLYGARSQLLGYVSNKGAFLLDDHKLIKAILINSADKIPGLDAEGRPQAKWEPGQVVLTDGVPNAIEPLNYAVGAGSANAAEALLQYREEGTRFWDFKTFTSTGTDFHYPFGAGKFTNPFPDRPFLLSLTATLVWDRHVDFTLSTDPDDVTLGTLDKDLLSNLDLILQRETAPGVWEDLRMSAGTTGSVEHLYFPELPPGGNYRINVRATSLAEPGLGETYALAVVYSTVPEPGSLAMLLGGIGLLAFRRSRPLFKTR